MKTILCIAAVCGLAASSARADIIEYKVSGTLALTGGGDIGGLNGASLTFTALFDNSGTYIERFGFPTVDGGPGSMTVSGAASGTNNTTTSTNQNAGYYPTFAGAFSSPDGLYMDFFTGDGQLFQFLSNTTPATGAGDAFVGGAIELDDFAPGSTYVGSGITSFSTGDSYALINAEVTARIVPAPSALALLGVLAIGRRRR